MSTFRFLTASYSKLIIYFREHFYSIYKFLMLMSTYNVQAKSHELVQLVFDVIFPHWTPSIKNKWGLVMKDICN